MLAAVTDYIYTVYIDENGRSQSTRHGPACLKVTGYSPRDFANDPRLWFRMIHDDDREVVLERTNQVSAGVPMPPIEHRIIHKDGSVRWIRNTTVLHRNRVGRLTAYDGLICDITEPKMMEQALATSEERYRLLFHRNLGGILLSTFSGEVLDCNESFGEFWATPLLPN